MPNCITPPFDIIPGSTVMRLVAVCTRDRVDLHKIVLCESRLYRLLTFSTLEHIPPASNRGIPKGLRMSESGALDSFWKDRVMAKPYSDDLRVRAIAIVEGGASRHEV